MAISHPELEKFNPCRQLCWRWDRAFLLAEDGRRFSPRSDDEWTGLALRYWRELLRCRDEGAREKVYRRYPEVRAARLLDERGDNLTAEIQARLLTRQTTEEVAALTGVSVEVMNAYEALFYQITDRLDARDWITLKAIGYWDFGIEGRSKQTVLKGYAYHGGLVVLDAALPYLLGNKLNEEPVADTSTPEGRLDRSIRLAIEVDTLPWDEEATQKLLKAHLELLRGAREQAAGRREEDVMGRQVADALDLAADALKEVAKGSQKAAGRERRRTA